MRVRIDRDYLCATLVRLIGINSINPSLVLGAPGECEICDFIARSVAAFGVEAEIIHHGPGRASTLARLRGTGGGRSLMFNGHVDTVGVDDMAEPFSAAVRDGNVYGRGAFDMKSGLAAAMAAVKGLAESGARLRGDVLLAAVGDEEYGSMGTAAVLERVKTDGAVVAEPTGLDLCLAHKGFLWIEVEVEGRAAHGSRFDLGIDANMKMGRFLALLDELEQELRARPPHPLVGPPSLHAATLAGGSGLSTYAARSKVQIERRTVPGEAESQAVAEIERLVERASTRDLQFHATVRRLFAREPFEVAPDAPIVRAMEGAVTAVRGRPPARIGQTPWMDAALCRDAGIETVVIGAAGAGAHAAVEWAELESVTQLAEALALAAADYCA